MIQGSRGLYARFLGLQHAKILRKMRNREVFRFKGVQNLAQQPDIGDLRCDRINKIFSFKINN